MLYNRDAVVDDGDESFEGSAEHGQEPIYVGGAPPRGNALARTPPSGFNNTAEPVEGADAEMVVDNPLNRFLGTNHPGNVTLRDKSGVFKQLPG